MIVSVYFCLIILYWAADALHSWSSLNRHPKQNRFMHFATEEKFPIAAEQPPQFNIPTVNITMNTRGLKPRKMQGFKTRTFTRLNETKSIEEMAQPLLDKQFLQSIVLEWTRPMPTEYLSKPLVFVGPSGVGKNRLINILLRDYGKFFQRAVTHTTRAPRPSEVNGTHYHFISLEDFQQKNSSSHGSSYFVETAFVHNNSYGLSYQAWDSIHSKGKICIMEVDIQGAYSLRSMQRKLNIMPNYVFIAPPSIELLCERLVERGTESPQQIQLRLENAAKEIALANKSSFFRVVLVNDDISRTADTLFRCIRDWYPALPSASKIRMLQRRIKSIKQQLEIESNTTLSTESNGRHNVDDANRIDHTAFDDPIVSI